MKTKWKYEFHTEPLGETGDYEYWVTFDNGKDVLQSSSDEIDEEQAKQFCELLDLMPDLWSHRTDAAEFELSIVKRNYQALHDLIQFCACDQPDFYHGDNTTCKRCGRPFDPEIT